MLGLALAADESVAVGVHRQALPAAQRGAIGIGHAAVGLAPGRLAGQGQVDRLVGVQPPRVPGVQVREAAVGRRLRHQSGIGQAGGRIILGVAGDRTGLLDRGFQARLVQVGGAGAALALAEVNGHGDATVAGGFNRLHLAHAHRHVQPALLAATHLGLAGAQRLRPRQQALRNLRQPVQPLAAVVVARNLIHCSYLGYP